MAKDLSYYMSLPYTLLIREVDDESGHYFHGRYAELDGCQSTADSVIELVQRINEAKEGWISAELDYGDPIPKPVLDPDDAYSGKFVVRVLKSLHRRLAENAEKEGVSLNQYVLHQLSE